MKLFIDFLQTWSYIPYLNKYLGAPVSGDGTMTVASTSSDLIRIKPELQFPFSQVAGFDDGLVSLNMKEAIIKTNSVNSSFLVPVSQHRILSPFTAIPASDEVTPYDQAWFSPTQWREWVDQRRASFETLRAIITGAPVHVQEAILNSGLHMFAIKHNARFSDPKAIVAIFAYDVPVYNEPGYNFLPACSNSVSALLKNSIAQPPMSWRYESYVKPLQPVPDSILSTASANILRSIGTLSMKVNLLFSVDSKSSSTMYDLLTKNIYEFCFLFEAPAVLPITFHRTPFLVKSAEPSLYSGANSNIINITFDLSHVWMGEVPFFNTFYINMIKNVPLLDSLKNDINYFDWSIEYNYKCHIV